MPIPAGEVFAGYTIVRLLGSGGMGEVYLVRHPRLPRHEALKILPERVSSDPQYRQRFEREADIAASLWHPHIVAVHDRGEHDGQLWIAMDYVEGTDAARLVRERHPNGLPAKDALEIVSAIADALDYAHERHLLHRDVKPANILISDPHLAERRILLADFGIARATNDSTGLTATNITVGSVGYSAPEQLTGQTLDGHADQYSLACTAFHLLTGGPPFGDSNPAAVISGHLSAPPPRLAVRRPDLSPLDPVLAKAVAKEPYARFDSCREFAAALGYAAGAAAGAAAATQFASRVPPPIPPSANLGYPNLGYPAAGSAARAAAWIIGVVAALLAVGLVAFIGARLGHPSAEPAGATPHSTPTVRATQPPQGTATDTATPRTTPPAVNADLGLSIPISHPACDGQGAVILGNVTTPGLYATGIQRLLDVHPGASYLRTDQSCRSLRQATEEGNPIYAVFTLAGRTQDQLCAAVRAAGGDAYGKWLDNTTDPGFIVPC